MAKNDKRKQLKCTPPRTADVKDITLDVSGEVNLEVLDEAFEAAVIELGRQLSKRYSNGDKTMKAVKFVADLHEAIKALKQFDGWGARSVIAEHLGYQSNTWDANGCGSANTDFGDLYETSEVQFAIAYRRPAKPAQQLRKLGTK
jgi:hypothetical protein